MKKIDNVIYIGLILLFVIDMFCKEYINSRGNIIIFSLMVLGLSVLLFKWIYLKIKRW